MSSTKSIICLICLLLSAVGYSAAAGQRESVAPVGGEGSLSAEAAFEPITIVDASGREITISKPVERIAYTHTFGDVLNILDSWNRVVAVDGSHQGGAIQYENMDKLPAISSPGNCMNINYEKVLELNPDIFLNVCTPSIPGFDDCVKTLEPEITVIALNFSDPSKTVDSFIKLGKILGKEKEADDFISFYNGIIDELSRRTEGLTENEKVRVFYKMGWGSVDEFVTFTDDAVAMEQRNRLTGSVNVSADLPSQGGWVLNIDPEWLVEQNPDVIIDGGMYHGIIGSGTADLMAAENLYESIKQVETISDMKAVKEDNLLLVWTDSFMTPEYIFNYAYIAKFLHPKLFADFDPAELHDEYFRRFIGTERDMISESIFVYPRI